MSYSHETELVISLSMVCFVSSLLRAKAHSSTLFWLCFVFGWELLTETSATVAAYYYHTNYMVYGVAEPVDLLFTILYFRSNNRLRRRSFFYFYLLLCVVLLQTFNVIFNEPLRILNTTFLQIKSLCIVLCCLLFFYTYVGNVSQPQYHFPIVCLFFIFYSTSFFIWTAIDFLGKEQTAIHRLYQFHLIIGLLFYAGVGIILLFSPHKKIAPYG